jgi:hypothetical protein
MAIACAAWNQAKGKHTAAECVFPQVQAQAWVALTDAAHGASEKTVSVYQCRDLCGSDWVTITVGSATKKTRMQIPGLPSSHTNDAIAMACAGGEVVKPHAVASHLHNGKRSEHAVWASCMVKGWKVDEVVNVKGRIGSIGRWCLTGAYVVKDLTSGKACVEVTSRILERLARPVQGWMITRLSFSHIRGKEGGASSPV